MEQLDIRQLIGEATEYDKKQALEVKTKELVQERERLCQWHWWQTRMGHC